MNVLILNQVFYPDFASTAQHAASLACALAEAGHHVIALAARRAYENPSHVFPRTETWNGIHIVRLPVTGFGKATLWRRALDSASFVFASLFYLLSAHRCDVIIALTTPPLIGAIAALASRIRGGRFVYWAMDLNPDEAITAGWLRATSMFAQLLDRINLFSLLQASQIIVLDRFMKERILRKGVPENRIAVVPPWSHDAVVRYDLEGRVNFRNTHRLDGKFVVMYSGNHSPCHPLNTLLEAARRLSATRKIGFCFVGGGTEFHKVEQFAVRHRLSNITCLPYQPFATLSASLSAADLHVVVMGDRFVGVVHPCKIYNILALGTPFLYIGPSQSHIGDLVASIPHTGLAHFVKHGDVDALVDRISEAAGQPRHYRGTALGNAFSQHRLLAEMVELIEERRAFAAGTS